MEHASRKILLVITIVALFGSIVEAPPARYSVETSVTGSGYVTKSPDRVEYKPGTTVKLTALSDLGWSFQGWGGDISGTENPTSILVDEAKKVSASFTQDVYTLTITTEGQGTASVTPLKDHYVYGEQIEVSATPAKGWQFQGWGGGVSGTDNPQTIFMKSSKIITARFTPMLYTLTVAVNPLVGGVVEQDPYKELYEYGDVVVLSQTPSTGYAFSGWSGDGVDLDGKRVVTISGDVAITVNYAVDVGGDGGDGGSDGGDGGTGGGDGGASGGATITINPVVKFTSSDLEGGSLNEGKIRIRLQNYTLPTEQEIRAGRYAVRYTPMPLQRFDHWEATGNVNVSNTRNPYTTLIVSGRGGLTAVYTPKIFDLSLYSRGEKGGSFVGNYSLGETTHELGQILSLPAGNHTLTFNLPTNYIFLGWETKGEIIVSSPSNTTTNITITGKGSITAIYSLALGNLEIDIVNTEGKPIVDAHVKAYSTQNNVPLFGKTDQTGHANINGVMLGEYYIDVAAQGYNDVTTTLIVERDDHTAHASLLLEKTIYNMKLEILDDSNKPVTGANITLYDTNGGATTSYITDANGCAYLDLTMDDYPVLVTCEGYQPTSIDLQVGGGDTIELTKLQLASHDSVMPLSSIVALTAMAILIPALLAVYMKRHLKPAINSDSKTIEPQ